MKKLPLLFVALFGFGLAYQSTAHAQREVIVEKKVRTKEVFVIENHRPIKRTVFIDERGRYYREEGGKRIIIERHYDSYPTEYFDERGNVRPGIKIVF